MSAELTTDIMKEYKKFEGLSFEAGLLATTFAYAVTLIGMSGKAPSSYKKITTLSEFELDEQIERLHSQFGVEKTGEEINGDVKSLLIAMIESDINDALNNELKNKVTENPMGIIEKIHKIMDTSAAVKRLLKPGHQSEKNLSTILNVAALQIPDFKKSYDAIEEKIKERLNAQQEIISQSELAQENIYAQEEREQLALLEEMGRRKIMTEEPLEDCEIAAKEVSNSAIEAALMATQREDAITQIQASLQQKLSKKLFNEKQKQAEIKLKEKKEEANRSAMIEYAAQLSDAEKEKEKQQTAEVKKIENVPESDSEKIRALIKKTARETRKLSDHQKMLVDPKNKKENDQKITLLISKKNPKVAASLKLKKLEEELKNRKKLYEERNTKGKFFNGFANFFSERYQQKHWYQSSFAKLAEVENMLKEIMRLEKVLENGDNYYSIKYNEYIAGDAATKDKGSELNKIYVELEKLRSNKEIFSYDEQLDELKVGSNPK